MKKEKADREMIRNYSLFRNSLSALAEAWKTPPGFPHGRAARSEKYHEWYIQLEPPYRGTPTPRRI